MQNQVTIDGVECVLVENYHVHWPAIEALGGELGYRKNGPCTLCAWSEFPEKCSPCPAGEEDVYVRRKYWPILKMRMKENPPT